MGNALMSRLQDRQSVLKSASNYQIFNMSSEDPNSPTNKTLSFYPDFVIIEITAGNIALYSNCYFVTPAGTTWITGVGHDSRGADYTITIGSIKCDSVGTITLSCFEKYAMCANGIAIKM